MKFANPYAEAATREVAPTPAPERHDATDVRRTRKVTNSPEQEWLARAGSTRPLPHHLVGAILSYTDRSTLQANGITIKRDAIGGSRTYHSADSPTCLPANIGMVFNWAINRLQPDVLYILNEQMACVDVIPQVAGAAWFDSDDMAREYRRTNAALKRTEKQLQKLRGKDDAERLHRLREAAEESHHAIRTLSPPDGSPEAPKPSANHPSVADAILETDRMRTNVAARRERIDTPLATRARVEDFLSDLADQPEDDDADLADFIISPTNLDA